MSRPGFYHPNVNTRVRLDEYISDLNLEISPEGYSCQPLCNDGFAYMWAGVKATYGIRKGKVCFEVKVAENLEVSTTDFTDIHVVRVGWSTDAATLQLGEDKNSFGYGGTAKKSEGRRFIDYGRRFDKGDVIGCYLAIENGWADMSYCVNGRHCGSAFKVRWNSDEALYPHVLSKNCRLEVNFGQAPNPYFSLLPGYKLIDHVPVELRVAAVRAPASKRDCEVIMMVGLPGVGKSTWAINYSKIHPSKKYNILGTDAIIDKMRVQGLPRKNNFGGRWDVLIKQASECFNIMLKKASSCNRNLILDQTNVYASARKRKVRQYKDAGYTVNAMVLVPTDEDMMRRSHQRTLEEGKDVPEAAVYDMKANFSLPHESENLFSKITFLELQREEAENLVLQYNSDANMKGYKSNKQSGIGANENQKEKNESNRRTSTSANRRDYLDSDRGSRSYDRSDDSRYRSDGRRRDSPRRDGPRDHSPDRGDRRDRRLRWEDSKESPRYELKKRLEDDRSGGPPEKYRRDNSPLVRPAHQPSGRDNERGMEGGFPQVQGRIQSDGTMTRNTQFQPNNQDMRYDTGMGRNNYTQEEQVPRRQPPNNNPQQFRPQNQISERYPGRPGADRLPAPPSHQAYIKSEVTQDFGSQDMDWEYPKDGRINQPKQSYSDQQPNSHGMQRRSDILYNQYAEEPFKRESSNVQRRLPVHQGSRPSQHPPRDPPVSGSQPDFHPPHSGNIQGQSAYGSSEHVYDQQHQQKNEYDETEYYQNEYSDNYDENYSGHQQDRQMEMPASSQDRRQDQQYKDEYEEDNSYYDNQEEDWSQQHQATNYQDSYSQPTRREHKDMRDPNENWHDLHQKDPYYQYEEGAEHQYHEESALMNRQQQQRHSQKNPLASQSYDSNFVQPGNRFPRLEDPGQYTDTHTGGDQNAWNPTTGQRFRPPTMQTRPPSNQHPRPRMPVHQESGFAPTPRLGVPPNIANRHIRGAPPNIKTETPMHEEDYNQQDQWQSEKPLHTMRPGFEGDPRPRSVRPQMFPGARAPGPRGPLLRGEGGIRPRLEAPMRFRGPRPSSMPANLRPQNPESNISRRPNDVAGQEPLQQRGILRHTRPPSQPRDAPVSDSTIQKLASVDFDRLKATLANLKQAELGVKPEIRHSYGDEEQEHIDQHFPEGSQGFDQRYVVNELDSRHPRNVDRPTGSQQMRERPPHSLNDRPPLHRQREKISEESMRVRKPLLPTPDDNVNVDQHNQPYDSQNTLPNRPRNTNDDVPYDAHDRFPHRNLPNQMDYIPIERDGQQQMKPLILSQRRPVGNHVEGNAGHVRSRPLLPNPEEDVKPDFQKFRPDFNQSVKPDAERRRPESRERSRPMARDSPSTQGSRVRSPHSRERSKTRERRSDRDSKDKRSDDKVDTKEKRDSRSGRDSKRERESRSERDSRSRRESRRDSRERDSKRDSESRRTRDRDHSSRRESSRRERSPHTDTRKSTYSDRDRRHGSPTRDRVESPGFIGRDLPVQDIEKLKSELELERAMLQAKKEAMEQAKREIYDEPLQKADEWDQLAAVQSLLLKEEAGIGAHSDNLPSLLDLPVNNKPGLLGAHPLSLEARPQLRLQSPATAGLPLRLPLELPTASANSTVRIHAPLMSGTIRQPRIERPALASPNSKHEPPISLLGSPLRPPRPGKNIDDISHLQEHGPRLDFDRNAPMRPRAPRPRPALLETPVHEPVDNENVMEDDDGFPEEVQVPRPLLRPRLRGPRPGMPRFPMRLRNPRPLITEHEVEGLGQMTPPIGARPQGMRLRGPRMRMRGPVPGEERVRLIRHEGVRPLRMRLPAGAIARRPVLMPPGQRLQRPMRPRMPLDHEEGSRESMFRMVRPAYRPPPRPRQPRPRFVGNTMM